MTTDASPSEHLRAPAWEASWLNGWMAAIGATKSTGLLLSFSRTPSPVPVFSRADGTAVGWSDLAEGLPTVEQIHQMAIARRSPGLTEFSRKPDRDAFAERSQLARAKRDRSLGATVTDLVNDVDLAHSSFDVAAPQGITVWQRLASCRDAIDDAGAEIEASARGLLPRVSTNGLGFDARRIAVATASDSTKSVDPVVECLAFNAMELFPVRGSGGLTPAIRGWSGRPTQRTSLAWPVWTDPLSWAAVDCLIDEFVAARPSQIDHGGLVSWARTSSRCSVFGAFGSVPYRWTSSMDSTRAYSSEELWMNL